MESPGSVSVWIGNCNDVDIFKKYVDIKYDENGDRIESIFMTDFKIDFIEYNQELLECIFSQYSSSSLSELLKNASYSHLIIHELESFYSQVLSEYYNVAILLYDFEYSDIVSEGKLAGNKLFFIGSVMYEE
ncbi:hypothetical protein HOO54_05500 [Bacillus sp. WMMC1349]|uniref:immunity 22 family protein n=1 Tax=Bacillus sp. WMMC1349 TaxID=2736254 RepID=UPI0015537A3E|nr:immunity 22 family protein [Bacillus sp. WMMC1349]NPC91705.1 hypothetical protein [Bacillus sp. WMMC1349]